jgi:hypothetical protein
MVCQLNNARLRELSDDELAAVSGAKPKEHEAGRYKTEYNKRFSCLGLTFFSFGGEGWSSSCIANDSRYVCATSAGGRVDMSSGPVPK